MTDHIDRGAIRRTEQVTRSAVRDRRPLVTVPLADLLDILALARMAPPEPLVITPAPTECRNCLGTGYGGPGDPCRWCDGTGQQQDE